MSDIIETIKRFASMKPIEYAQIRPMHYERAHVLDPHSGPHNWKDAQWTGDCSGVYLINEWQYQKCACGATRMIDKYQAKTVWIHEPESGQTFRP